MIRILITGGGTGGHVYPSLAVMDALNKRLDGQTHEFVYVGSRSPLEDAIRAKVARHHVISVGKYRRYFSLKNAADFYRTMFGFFQSLWILLREMPDVVFSKGGYVSVPVVLAAWCYRIPIVLHESDSVPGSANRFMGKFAKRVALGFPSAAEYFLANQVIVSGNPVQQEVASGNKERILRKLKLSESRPVLLVYGGSQGSTTINEHIVDALRELLGFMQIIHQTGTSNFEAVKHEAAERAGIKSGTEGYVPMPFLSGEDRADAIAAADVVISRSGAASIAELAETSKVTLLVPLLGSANDHQRMNAYSIAKSGAALVLEEGNLTRNILVEKLKKLLFEEELREKMKESIHRFRAPEAADVIAETVLSSIEK